MKKILLFAMLSLIAFLPGMMAGCADKGGGMKKDGLKAATLTAKDIRLAKDQINEYRKEMSTRSFDKALEALNKAVAINPVEVEAYIEKAEVHLMKDEIDKAIAAYDEAQKLDPEDIRILERKGAAYFRMKKHQEALDTFRQAQKINPSDERIYFAISTCYKMMNQEDKADEVFEEALKNNPDNKRFKDLYIRHLKARATRAKGQEKVDLNRKVIGLVDQILSENKGETTQYVIIYHRYAKVNALYQIWKVTSKDEDKKAAVEEARKFIADFKEQRFGRRELERSVDKLKEMTGEEIKLPQMNPPGRNFPGRRPRLRGPAGGPVHPRLKMPAVKTPDVGTKVPAPATPDVKKAP